MQAQPTLDALSESPTLDASQRTTTTPRVFAAPTDEPREADGEPIERGAAAEHAERATQRDTQANTLGARLLREDGTATAPSLVREAARFACGLGLAAVYGLAIGARDGGHALLTNALGAPSALLAVGALGVPSFAIILALMNAPVDGARLAAVTSRAVATSGLVLAGLAPAATLFAVTSSTRDAAALTAMLGLFVGGALGLARLLHGLRLAVSGADSATRMLALAASGGFGVFAIALAVRIWSSAIPALVLVGGAP